MKNFKLTILGSGTMMPTKERNPAGFLLEVGNKKILLDCGHGTIRRLVDFGFDPQDIDYIFISHFHTDHFSDCFPFIHARWVNDLKLGKKFNLLTIIGPQELQAQFRLWRKIFWREKGENFPTKFLEGERELKIGGIELEIFEVKHVEWFQSVGITIKFNRKKIVYTGDIGSGNKVEDLANIARNADLLITEGSMTDQTPNHFTLGQAKELINLAKVKKILVVHIGANSVANVKKACREDKRFVLGVDGLKLEI